MSKAWSRGSTAAWRRTRAAVLARDGHRCQLKLDGCTTRATQAHHLRGREVSGDNPQYLVAACQACNLAVGDPRRHDPPMRAHTRW